MKALDKGAKAFKAVANLLLIKPFIYSVVATSCESKLCQEGILSEHLQVTGTSPDRMQVFQDSIHVLPHTFLHYSEWIYA